MFKVKLFRYNQNVRALKNQKLKTKKKKKKYEKPKPKAKEKSRGAGLCRQVVAVSSEYLAEILIFKIQ